jgi:hypothetical protein
MPGPLTRRSVHILVQAKVFQLADDTGKPTGKVIKINHGDIGSKMLNNNASGLVPAWHAWGVGLPGWLSHQHARTHACA